MAGFAAGGRESISGRELPNPKQGAAAPLAARGHASASIPASPLAAAAPALAAPALPPQTQAAPAQPVSAHRDAIPRGNNVSAPLAPSVKAKGILARKDSSVSERDHARFVRTSLKNGRRICIKYPLKQSAPPSYWLDKMIADCAGQPFMLPVPPLPAEERNLAEIAKLRALRAASVPVPEILAVQNGFSVFADAGKNIDEVLKELRPRSAELYDKLLIRCGQTLGRAHAANICIGRPNLRNMFLAPHGIGFSGFMDYPERAMPIADAQMRDIWLLLRLLAARAVNKDAVLRGAFRAWRRPVGLETLESLRSAARFFRMILRPCQICSPLLFSKKQKNKLYIIRFLVANAGI